MKAWNTIQANRNSINKEINIMDFFRAEIFDSKVVVSEISKKLGIFEAAPAKEVEVCDINPLAKSDSRLIKAILHSNKHSKAIQAFLEKEKQYGELF